MARVEIMYEKERCLLVLLSLGEVVEGMAHGHLPAIYPSREHRFQG